MRGEIVGVAGVSGNGQKELVEVLAASAPPTGGEVLVAGEPYDRTRDEAQPRRPLPARGAAAQRLRRQCRWPRTWPSARFDRRRLARRPLARPPRHGRERAAPDRPFRVKTPSERRSARCPAATSSARPGPRAGRRGDLLIVANPCFGLDFKAVAEIRARIVAAAQRRRRRAAGHRGPRRDPRAGRPYRGDARGPHRPRDAGPRCRRHSASAGHMAGHD